MSLKRARDAVETEILSNTDGSPDKLMELLKVWWTEFKRWERQETFARAFYDRRMSIRTYYPPGGKAPSKWEMVRKNISAKPVGGVGTKLYDDKYDVSGKGVHARTIPANFYSGPGSPSRKYRLGLHDLSASLLDPSGPISTQLYHRLDKSDSNGALAVFMPLPLPEDNSLIEILQNVVKHHPTSPMYPMIREYRSKMTRIKLAHERDLGANFSALQEPRGHGEKGGTYRYGFGATIKDKGLPAPRRIKPEDKQRIILNAFRYRTILTSANKARYNEIIISYRKHDKAMFPLFARWEHNKSKTGNGRFHVFEVVSNRDKDEFIGDQPRRDQ